MGMSFEVGELKNEPRLGLIVYLLLASGKASRVIWVLGRYTEEYQHTFCQSPQVYRLCIMINTSGVPSDF